MYLFVDLNFVLLLTSKKINYLFFEKIHKTLIASFANSDFFPVKIFS